MIPLNMRDYVRDVLPQVANLLKSHESSEVEVAAFRLFYFLASNEGKELTNIFPESYECNLPQSTGDALQDIHGNADFYSYAEESYSHSGRNCGRKFNKGEPIYRCLDCGLDSTCVLCVHCFNKDDHRGHHVTVSVCLDRNKGICDCGDPEAWVKEVHCKSSASQSDILSPVRQPLSEAIPQLLKTLYDEILRYIVIVFSHQNQSIPFVQEIVKALLRQDLLDDALSALEGDIEQSSASYRIDESPEEYNLVFWNDEYHNFQEAQDAIRKASHCTHRVAVELSQKIDTEGRAILRSESSIKDLLPGLKSSIQTDFAASIITSSELRKQDFVKILFKWLLHSIESTPLPFQTAARNALCQSLCSSVTTLDVIPYWNSKTKTLKRVSGLLYGNEIPKNVSPELYSVSSNQTFTVVQYLTFFDIRYWKVLRKQVHDLLISSLVADLDFKAVACSQIVEIYDVLLENHYYYDREPHLNIMSEISIQFFTCPINSTEIVSSHLMNVLLPIQEVLQDMLVKVGDNKEVFRFPTRLRDISTRRKKTVRQTIADLALFFQKSNTLSQLYSDLEFITFFKIVQLFDNCYEIKRKTGEHAENEDLSFAYYFSTVLPLAEVISAATDPEKMTSVDIRKLKAIILGVLPYVRTKPHKLKKVNGFEIVDFVVSKEESGFLHPSSVLLSRLLGLLIKSLSDLKETCEPADFLKISDESLRSIVLEAQIESQYWIRNGESALSQALAYKTHPVARQLLYLEDLHMCQLSLLLCDNQQVLLNILDRFELLDWFMGNQSLDDTIYEEKVVPMVEKLVSFLYLLLSERDRFIYTAAKEERQKGKLKTCLIYNLFTASLTYSEIEDFIDEEDLKDPSFEEVLNEVSNFSPPKGLNDDGHYSLKPEFFKTVDPLRLEAQTKDFQDGYAILAKKLVKGNQSPDDIVIEPRLTKIDAEYDIGAFTRTFEFAKLLSKLLSYAIEKNSESLVPFVLHLLYAAIKNEEQRDPQSGIIDAYTQVPICENLFSIYTTADFSNSTKKKADFILEKLIVKDRVYILNSLLSCFGEEPVKKYKENKKSNGVDFDETEAERKRRLAKERQKKILAQMRKKQKAFIEHNDAATISAEEREQKQFEEHIRHCVLCQNPESGHEMLCAPISFNNSNVFRKVPSHSPLYVKRALMNWAEDSIENSLGAEGLSFPTETLLAQGQKKQNVHVHNVASSCNHYIHLRCLQSYMGDNNYRTPSFACPLCKTTHQTYIPTTLKKDDLTPEILESPELDLEDMDDSFGGVIFRSVAKPPNMGGINDLDVSLLMNFKEDYENNLKFYKRVTKLGSTLAFSISQAEISTRINGGEAYKNFLNQIPEQTYKVLKSLLEYYLLVVTERSPPHSKAVSDSKDKLAHGDFIDTFIYHLFSGILGFKKLAHEMIKFFTAKYSTAVLVAVSQYSHWKSLIKYNEDFDSMLIRSFRGIFGNIVHTAHEKISADVLDDFFNDDFFTSMIVNAVQTFILPDLRNLAILYKIFIPDFDLKFDEDVLSVGVDEMLIALGLDSFNSILANEEYDMLFSLTGTILKTSLPYSGVIKLIDLPAELSYFSTTPEHCEEADLRRFPTDRSVDNSSNRIDFAICLTCGHKVFTSIDSPRVYSHLTDFNCASQGGGAFLFPNTDIVKLVSVKGAKSLNQIINAPYMNSHGQSGERAVRNGLIATLNIDRLTHLNNLWLTGGIYPYLSRNSIPMRIPIEGMEEGLELRLWRRILASEVGDGPGLWRDATLDTDITQLLIDNMLEGRRNGAFGGVLAEDEYENETDYEDERDEDDEDEEDQDDENDDDDDDAEDEDDDDDIDGGSSSYYYSDEEEDRYFSRDNDDDDDDLETTGFPLF